MIDPLMLGIAMFKDVANDLQLKLLRTRAAKDRPSKTVLKPIA